MPNTNTLEKRPNWMTQQRCQIQFEARVTSVADSSDSGVGLVTDISNPGFCVCLPVRLRAGDMVAVEIADSMVYGHVIYSRPDGTSYRTSIEALRVLLGGTELSNLLQRILMESLPGIAGLEPVETVCGLSRGVEETAEVPYA